jgi:hypothetical protein
MYADEIATIGCELCEGCYGRKKETSQTFGAQTDFCHGMFLDTANVSTLKLCLDYVVFWCVHAQNSFKCSEQG